MNLSSRESSPHDELPQPYRIAVQTILAEPMPIFDPSRLLAHPVLMKVAQPSRRRWITQIGRWSLIAAAAAVVLVASLVVLRPVDAWAQVVSAVRKQAWVRMRLAAPAKSTEKPADVEIWVSPAKRIGAGRFPGIVLLLDLDQSKMQRFDPKENTIYISEPMQRDLDGFIDLDSMLDSFASRQQPRQSKAKSIKLLGQSSMKGSAGAEGWTDYTLDYEDADRSPPRFRRVFRVPDGAELPTTMTEEFVVDGKTASRTYKMDYPASGPEDLASLGAPQNAKVVDLRSGEEQKLLLAAYKEQQTAALEPYSAMVLVSVDDFRYLSDAFQVRCDGKSLSVQSVDAQQLLDFTFAVSAGDIRRPEGADRLAWWKDEVKKMRFHSIDSQMGMYFPHQVNYPLLGLPTDDVKVRTTLNPKPLIGPSDSQMLAIEDANLGNRRYWFDPARGSMAVRMEHSNAATPGDGFDTTLVDDVEKSPKGRWYATQIRCGQVARSGDDLPAKVGTAPVATQTYRYFIKFD